MIIAGCSRRKKPTTEPIPALDLYEGGCIPGLRDRLGDDTRFRQRIRIISAFYGLLHADSHVVNYDRRLTNLADAYALRQRVAPQLDDELAGVTHVLALVEPLYLFALEPVVQRLDAIRLSWIAAPRDLHGAAAVLDTWGWT
ncbi:hypothetical protein KBO27_22430 [Saccharopolyspora endophytica]|uniref:DUF6884 domain-containing protein n=1 Tax=Saccharopolyspora endophytica TaxID=543886 RepID=A0ABS5DKE3_9PSEU|nr:hypothetical protein [Saccharopolyspora endophytica]